MNMYIRLTAIFSKLVLVFSTVILLFSCGKPQKNTNRVSVLSSSVETNVEIIPAAENVAEYYHLLKDKKVGLVVNQTSRIGDRHLVDSLLDLNRLRFTGSLSVSQTAEFTHNVNQVARVDRTHNR